MHSENKKQYQSNNLHVLSLWSSLNSVKTKNVVFVDLSMSSLSLSWRTSGNIYLSSICLKFVFIFMYLHIKKGRQKTLTQSTREETQRGTDTVLIRPKDNTLFLYVTNPGSGRFLMSWSRSLSRSHLKGTRTRCVWTA